MRNIVFIGAFLTFTSNLHASCPKVDVIQYGLQFVKDVLKNGENVQERFKAGLKLWPAEGILKDTVKFADNFEEVARNYGNTAPLLVTEENLSASSLCTYKLVTPIHEAFLLSFEATPTKQ